MERDNLGLMVWAAAFANAIAQARKEGLQHPITFATERAENALYCFNEVLPHRLPWPLTEPAPGSARAGS